MSAIYDNWERLVGAVLKKEQLWQLFHADSVSVSSDSSGFSFSDDGWSASINREIVNSKKYLNNEVPKQQSYPLPLPPNSGAVESPWKKGKLLGEGLLGGVYLGFNSANGGMCTMKEVLLSCYGDVQQRANMLQKDIPQLSRMRHPHIVQCYGSEMVADNFYIYYEYMSCGTIYMVLEQYGKLGESVISGYTQQILSGLAYLHSNRIAHRGIKGANILIDPKGTVKLSNFGIEKQIAERFDASWMMDNPYWTAPEVRKNPNICNLAVDIWSLGCTVLEMATSKPPVMAMSKVPRIPDELSNVCKDFISRCLHWDPFHRATAFQLLEHPFIKGFSPLGDRMLFSVTNSVKSEQGIDEMQGRKGDESDCVKVISHSDFRPSDVLGPRLPQQLSLRTSSTQHNFPQYQSPCSNTPYYWHPIILRRIFT